MNSLPILLERFNRKERNLLVRAVLADDLKRPNLSQSFRTLVSSAPRLPDIPNDAWWATDYHISWLAGALGLFMTNEQAPTKPRAIKSYPDPEGMRQLVESNQEDIDLIVATETDLILIEAKAHSSFKKEQLESKLARLELLYEFYTELAKEKDRSICFHLLLISPFKPVHLKNIRWPRWACEGDHAPWIPLKLDETISILTVTRCAFDGKSKAGGDFWRVLKYQLPWNGRKPDKPNA